MCNAKEHQSFRVSNNPIQQYLGNTDKLAQFQFIQVHDKNFWNIWNLLLLRQGLSQSLLKLMWCVMFISTGTWKRS